MLTASLVLAALLGGAAAAEAPAGTIDWSYHPPNGPYVWDRIVNASTGEREYPDCGGSKQTPIDICRGTPLAAPGPLTISGHCATVEFGFLAPSFKWSYKPAPGETCTAAGQNGVVYDLLQFHIHAPSEHTLDGKYLDAELHFVHAAADGNLLVVGVWLYAEGDADNTWVEAAFKHLTEYDSVPGCCKTLPVPPLELLVPCKGGWYNYEGSLTTPPCSEIVEWWMAATPVRISKRQLRTLRTQQALSPYMNKYGGDNRPIQPLNGREVRAYGV